MALKPNFFQAIAALTLAYQAFKYIRRQAALLEKWDYDILAVRLLGVTKDFLDLQNSHFYTYVKTASNI